MNTWKTKRCDNSSPVPAGPANDVSSDLIYHPSAARRRRLMPVPPVAIDFSAVHQRNPKLDLFNLARLPQPGRGRSWHWYLRCIDCKWDSPHHKATSCSRGGISSSSSGNTLWGLETPGSCCTTRRRCIPRSCRACKCHIRDRTDSCLSLLGNICCTRQLCCSGGSHSTDIDSIGDMPDGRLANFEGAEPQKYLSRRAVVGAHGRLVTPVDSRSTI
jgi:hypothetical protein